MFLGQDVAGLAAEEHPAACRAALGAQLDEVVGLLHHVEAVLDEDEAVARVRHLVEEQQQPSHVVEVQAVGRLVDDVGVARREACLAVVEMYGRLVEVVGKLHALQLAAAERAHRLVEVQIAQPHLLQHTQLRQEGLPLEEGDGLLDRQRHHLGDVLAAVAVLQRGAVVAAALAFLAHRLDALHERHVGHDDALAAAGGTGSLAVEREELDAGTLAGLARRRGGSGAAADGGGAAGRRLRRRLADPFADEEAPYRVGDVEVGGGGAAQVDADVLLADEDGRGRLVAALKEMLHERALARACHADDDGHHVARYLERHILEVVQVGMAYLVPSLRLAHTLLQRRAEAQHLPRDGLRTQEACVVALIDDAAAVVASPGAHIDDIVGKGDDLAVMLHDEHRVAVVAQVLQRPLEARDVLRMQPHAGLVEHVGHVSEGRIDVFGYLDALCLAAAEGARAAAEGEVAHADVAECLEPLLQLALEVARQGMVYLIDEEQRLADGHGHHVGEVLAVDAAAAHTLVEPRAVAFGAFGGADHQVQHLLLPLALLGGDDAAVHARVEPLELGRLGPVGGRVLEPHLRRIEEEIQLLGRVVLDFLIEVEEAAVGVALPTPGARGEGGEVDDVLVVEALVEIHQLVDVQVGHRAHAAAARTAARRVVEREGVAVAHEGRPHAREEEAQQGIDVGVRRHRRTRVVGGLLLVDDDGHGHVLDALHLGAPVFGEVLLHEARKGLVELATALGGDGVEAERRLARARHACEDRDFALGYLH